MFTTGVVRVISLCFIEVHGLLLFLCDHWPMIVVILVSFQKNFCVLKEEDILKHQIDAIERVSVVLSITEVEASILLRSFHW